jgi:hypothetical protein
MGSPDEAKSRSLGCARDDRKKFARSANGFPSGSVEAGLYARLASEGERSYGFWLRLAALKDGLYKVGVVVLRSARAGLYKTTAASRA